MKYLLRMFIFDIKMSFRSFMGTYIAVVPLFVLLILRFFIPGVESSSFTIAAVTEGPNAVPEEMLNVLDDFADIKTYPGIEKMEKKLRGTGSAEGLYRDPDNGQYVSVMERNIGGNRNFSLSAQVIRQHYYQKHYPDASEVSTFHAGVPGELSGRTATSPVATMGGAIFLVFMIIISSFIIGLGVVDDKECGVDQAFLVSPVSKSDYYIGKSIYPFFVILFYTIIGLLVLDLMHVDILQVYLLVTLSFSITLLVGLLIGAIANNENEAVGIGKMLAMIMLFSILGGTLLSGQWQWGGLVVAILLDVQPP
ncbi:MAG: ABC transporter permease [Candidatus Marinimicrobia bacterium]|nr:ABC transporter permease [Candidatus Neomarinimicrobiota bacterium]